VKLVHLVSFIIENLMFMFVGRKEEDDRQSS